MLRNVLLMLLVLLVTPFAQANALVFKIATLSPDGSSWMNKMRDGAAEITRRTQGRVTFKFYPGGVMGNAQSVLRKIRIRQLQGGTTTAGSLGGIYPEIKVYGLPLLFRSFEEVDYVRVRMDDLLAKGLEQRGFVSFGLAEGGFAYLMSKAPIRSIHDLRKQKVWVPVGEKISYVMFETAAVSPIPLPLADVLTGLQTGLINTVATSSTAAIALQWHAKLKYVTDTPLAYFYALLVIDRKAFLKARPDDQTVVREVMARVFKDINQQNRVDNQRAREALRRQGIEFVSPSTEALAQWKEIATKANARLRREGVVPLGVLNALQSHLDAYRNSRSPASAK